MLLYSYILTYLCTKLLRGLFGLVGSILYGPPVQLYFHLDLFEYGYAVYTGSVSELVQHSSEGFDFCDCWGGGREVFQRHPLTLRDFMLAFGDSSGLGLEETPEEDIVSVMDVGSLFSHPNDPSELCLHPGLLKDFSLYPLRNQVPCLDSSSWHLPVVGILAHELLDGQYSSGILVVDQSAYSHVVGGIAWQEVRYGGGKPHREHGPISLGMVELEAVQGSHRE